MDTTGIYRLRTICNTGITRALALLFLTAVGSGSLIGVSSQLPVLGRDQAGLGPEVGYRGYLLNSQGPLLGASGSILFKTTKSCCHEFRTRVDAGYGVLPLLHESHWGFEATASPTLGNVVVDHRGRFAAGGTGALALLYRVTPSRDLWQQNSIVEPLPLLVPRIGFEFLAPTGPVSHGPVMALEFSITFRYMQWPTIAP